jgi:hypothetical protein
MLTNALAISMLAVILKGLVSDQVLPGYTPAEAVLLPTQATSWPSFNALRARIGRPGEGDAMAEALGARISGRHGAQEADTPTPVRESRPYQNLPDWPRQSRQEQKDLALKAKCTTTKERPISRWEQEAVLVQARLDRNPDKMCLRRQTVEHPFGTIKSWMHYRLLRFSRRGQNCTDFVRRPCNRCPT